MDVEGKSLFISQGNKMVHENEDQQYMATIDGNTQGARMQDNMAQLDDIFNEENRTS